MISRRDLLNLSTLVGIGAASATDHLIVRAVLGRRFDWGHHSLID